MQCRLQSNLVSCRHQKSPRARSLMETARLEHGGTLHTLSTPFGAALRPESCSTGTIKEGGYLTEHVQLPLIVDYPDEFLDEITWQELMNNWANQGLGQFLADDKAVLVAHINRAVTYEGVLTKHKRALNRHGAFTVPRSLDGFSRASSEYMPIAYICHRGPTHDCGHYFAILVYRDLMWIADDGGHPTVLPFLTPQLAGQIVQIWAVQTTAFVTPRQIQRALPAPETPDYDPPLHGTPPKKARFTQDSMRLHVANITTFGKHTLDWLWSRDNDIHIMVETHLDKQKHNTLFQYFEVRGPLGFQPTPTTTTTATMEVSWSCTPTIMESRSLRTITSKAAGFKPFCGKPRPDPSWLLRSTSRPTRRSKDPRILSSLADFWHWLKPPTASTSSSGTGMGIRVNSRAQSLAPNSTGRSSPQTPTMHPQPAGPPHFHDH